MSQMAGEKRHIQNLKLVTKGVTSEKSGSNKDAMSLKCKQNLHDLLSDTTEREGNKFNTKQGDFVNPTPPNKYIHTHITALGEGE